ncbi:hypothetical protein RJ641_026498 [Dillenia turbinata]|uniref:Uncharacterized protein n=1 Tax=Dillenia turbinata TaxID=194707 RepID=A0AAN8WB56_9MAGN
MKSLVLPSTFLFHPVASHGASHSLRLGSPKYFPYHFYHYNHQKLSSPSSEFPGYHTSRSLAKKTSITATIPSNEGTSSVIHFEEIIEKDWSFLDFDDTNSSEEHRQKVDRIILAGEIADTSRVLVSTASEEFVDRLVEFSPRCDLLLIVHDSLLVLACIKEKYDKVKCWQGELIHVPEKWAPFDVVFLYFLPALPFEPDHVFRELAQRCQPGARVVISHLQGREILEQQKQQYSDVLISNLPDKITLEKIAIDHSFQITKFVDESGFYLAVLKFLQVK